MATYAIGDLQGCLDPLLALLETLNYDPTQDQLWFAGDLINRGPQSLASLRYVKALGDNAITVLGNHDLHLLAALAGVRKPSRKDTLQEILDAPDCDELCHWLRHLPLLHSDQRLNTTMVHAGIHPSLDLETAQQLAHEVEQQLRADDYVDFLRDMYGNQPATWNPSLSGYDRLRFGVNCLTRMRYLRNDGSMDFNVTCHPDDAPDDVTPWFRYPQRQPLEHAIVFGHWSTVGDTRQGNDQQHNVHGLDRGCVWGGSLAAIELPSMQIIETPCVGALTPGD
ncbi:MAG: symmetrical bis(5'-nucleosyl)-tetraphosphatase [Granulosicoccus sp.]|nr:symmetrical bis(5'-nucleosyl)-tetraphosphatase [Granulosicoccus sp.]